MAVAVVLETVVLGACASLILCVFQVCEYDDLVLPRSDCFHGEVVLAASAIADGRVASLRVTEADAVHLLTLAFDTVASGSAHYWWRILLLEFHLCVRLFQP